MTHNTKREYSAKQKVNLLIKMYYTLTESIKTISTKFFSTKRRPYYKNIALKEFAKQNKIGENTIRNQIKFPIMYHPKGYLPVINQ